MMLNEKNTELAMEKKEKSLHQEHKMYVSNVKLTLFFIRAVFSPRSEFFNTKSEVHMYICTTQEDFVFRISGVWYTGRGAPVGR